MPKKTTELTALEVKNLKNGTYAVGGVKGLYIRAPHRTCSFCAIPMPRGAMTSR